MEKLEAYALATVGAIEGIYKYYVKPELSAGRAWTALALGITAYELCAPNGQLMTEGFHRGLERHPVLMTALVGVTALHLLDICPPQIDPYHKLTEVFR